MDDGIGGSIIYIKFCFSSMLAESFRYFCSVLYMLNDFARFSIGD